MISNSLKGETTVKAGDVSYVLRYTANSLCALEDAFDKSVSELSDMFSKPSNMRISTMRKLFWIGLIDAQPQVTEVVAGEIMTKAGLDVSLIKVMEAFQEAFPKAKQEDEGNQNPRKARRAGIGKG